jgi:NAD+ synthetase
MTFLPLIEAPKLRAPDLTIDTALATEWLVAFLRDELVERRGVRNAVLGLSGGVDSAVVAFLAVRALGAEHVHAIRMPYRTSSPDSLADAQTVIDALGCASHTLDISGAVDGYLALEPDADARRRGNVMARTRMLVLFDQSAKLAALPIGTGNKTERMMGYFTWHADDSPPVNPIGDLFKTQVWQLARHLGVPLRVIDKPPSADLEANQTDESDLGITYVQADRILSLLLSGRSDEKIVAHGISASDVALVRRRVENTHWKRHLPTTALLTNTAINEFYLRPVDY